MRRQLVPAVISMVVFTLLFGVAFPLVITGIGQVAFHHQAEGSIVEQHGTKIGSSLIGQAFTDVKGAPLSQYFQSRPSAALGAAGDTVAGYDPTESSGSNLGPSNPELLKLVDQRVKAYRKLNGLADDTLVPVDAVTASASGLDPDISVANARLQAGRVARERGMPVAKVRALIDDHTQGRTLGIVGEQTVDVLALNRALDRAAR
ncbi:MAG TPA: K(+)-transporting ATPase subunit C [Acidimicrobiia bacterium]|jgi:K+-transporting ATPase ATPase C chain|nr:K(+)-transporting ATPase subunit C [Acidimicrobiia bacterium]